MSGTVLNPKFTLPLGTPAGRETMKLVRSEVLARLSQQPSSNAPSRAIKWCAPTTDPRLVMLADPSGAQAAGFRVLRDALMTRGMPRVIAVSSAESGEGKTTCAVNLALALAEQRAEKLLLVDANFLAPALARILGVEETTTGWQEQAWTAPFALSALAPNLHVATITRQPGQPTPYVDVATLSRLLDASVRAGYHRVIVDTVPIESSPEGNPLLQLAGGVLLTARAGRTSSGALRRAVERIVPGKALGVTLLDAPVPSGTNKAA